MTNPNESAAYVEAERTTYVSIVGNTTLGLLKLFVGLAGSSLALVADAVHTLSDTATSVAVWAGLKIAKKPADDSHPYGHGKAEPIAGKTVAILLAVVGLLIAWESAWGIIAYIRGQSSLERPSQWTLYAALVSILVKEWMYHYQVRVGRKYSMVSLIADAWHHRSDALSSVGVAIGIGAAMLGGPKWHWADEAAALVVAALILWVAVDLFRQTSVSLMDTQTPSEVRDRIRAIALGVPGVRDVEKIIARRSGYNVLVDLHVEVDPEMPVREGHRIATEVKAVLIRDIDNVSQVLVHIEPYYPGDH